MSLRHGEQWRGMEKLKWRLLQLTIWRWFGGFWFSSADPPPLFLARPELRTQELGNLTSKRALICIKLKILSPPRANKRSRDKNFSCSKKPRENESRNYRTNTFQSSGGQAVKIITLREKLQSELIWKVAVSVAGVWGQSIASWDGVRRVQLWMFDCSGRWKVEDVQPEE